MGKFIEISIFIIISVVLGFLISIPLFVLSMQDPLMIEGIGEIDIYKTLVIFMIISLVVFLIVKNVLFMYRKDEETRKYIFRKYPPVISHIMIFLTQIIPSLFPSWLKFITILAFVLFIIPRIIGIWFDVAVLTIDRGALVNVIFNIILTQLIFAPVICIMMLRKYLDRQRINESDKKTDLDNDITNNENKKRSSFNIINLLKRFSAGIIDLILYISAVTLFVFVAGYLSDMFFTLKTLSVRGVINLISIISGFAGFMIISLVQLSLITNKGYTIGKLIFGLRINDVSSGHITAQQAFSREIMLKLFGGMMYLGFIGLFFGKDRKKMIHDKLIGSNVV